MGKIDESKIKTKVWRLYDIANVLTSLKLIKKTQLIETRKPAFKWIGESGFNEFMIEMKYEFAKSNQIDAKNEANQGLANKNASFHSYSSDSSLDESP